MDRLYVGQETVTEWVFDEREVRLFAEITGDQNPVHLDSEYAAKGKFGRTIVHGILLAGLISKVIGMELPGKGSIYLEQDLQFKKPVFVGEKVTAKVKITDIHKNKIFTLETNIYDKDNCCVINGTAKVLYESQVELC